MAMHQWRVIPAREDHEQAERRRWLIKFAKKCWGSSLNGTRNCCRSGNKHRISTFHSDIWTCRECPLNLSWSCWWSKKRNSIRKFLRTRSILQIMTQNLLRPSSLVMRPRFMVTTQKPNFNPRNGSIRNHQGQKKLSKFAAMWKWC